MATAVTGAGDVEVRGAKGAAGGAGVSGAGSLGDAPPDHEYLHKHLAYPEDLQAAKEAAWERAGQEALDAYVLSPKERAHRKRRRKIAKASRAKARRR